MLAADNDTLSEPIREAVRRFFDANAAWLTAVFDTAKRGVDTPRRHLRRRHRRRTC